MKFVKYVSIAILTLCVLGMIFLDDYEPQFDTDRFIDEGKGYVDEYFGKEPKQEAYTGSLCKTGCVKYLYDNNGYKTLIVSGDKVVQLTSFNDDRKTTGELGMDKSQLAEYFGIKEPNHYRASTARWNNYKGYSIGVFGRSEDKIDFNIELK